MKVNPKGQVPALALDSGELVTEGPVIVEVIADKAAGKSLAPARDGGRRRKHPAAIADAAGNTHEL